MLAAQVGKDSEMDVTERYEQLIAGWNERDADRFAASFADDGTMIGFDGSEVTGRDTIREEIGRIFADHVTAPYVAKVRSVRTLGADVAVLRAVVGMAPGGDSELAPDKNAHQTVVASRDGGEWQIVLFQNTPAQFHGRPELVERLTAELREVARQ
jgi:uncharacterized protein (TIGR02246 family)